MSLRAASCCASERSQATGSAPRCPQAPALPARVPVHRSTRLGDSTFAVSATAARSPPSHPRCRSALVPTLCLPHPRTPTRPRLARYPLVQTSRPTCWLLVWRQAWLQSPVHTGQLLRQTEGDRGAQLSRTSTRRGVGGSWEAFPSFPSRPIPASSSVFRKLLERCACITLALGGHAAGGVGRHRMR